MKIIKSTLDEIPDIIMLNSFVQKMHHDKFPDIFKPVGNSAELNKLFEHIIKQENNILFIAYKGENPAGYAWVEFQNKPDYSLKYGKKQAYIHQISVHENFRKQDIGRSLFNEIENLAEKKGIDHFELDSWAFNTGAHKFFEQLGFQTYNVKMWRKSKHAT